MISLEKVIVLPCLAIVVQRSQATKALVNQPTEKPHRIAKAAVDDIHTPFAWITYN